MLLLVFIATALGYTVVTLMNGAESDAAGIAALVQLGAMIAAFVASLMWIYRINANAQSFADGLSITPGWNVGWFFVPVANLWRPFEGIRESWQASEDAANWPTVAVPTLLRAWWGFWIAGNILSNVGLQLSRAMGPGSSLELALEALSSVALAAAAVLLIVAIRRLDRLQRRIGPAHVFA